VKRAIITAIGLIGAYLCISYAHNYYASKQLAHYAPNRPAKDAGAAQARTEQSVPERHLHKFGETVEQFLASEKGALDDRTCTTGGLRDESGHLCELVVADTGASHTKRFYIFRDGALSQIELSVFDTPYATVVEDVSARYGAPVQHVNDVTLERGTARGESTLWRVVNEHVWATSETTYHEWDNSTFTYTHMLILSDAEFHAQGLDDNPHASF
jgi:hypothetical protein